MRVNPSIKTEPLCDSMKESVDKDAGQVITGQDTEGTKKTESNVWRLKLQ